MASPVPDPASAYSFDKSFSNPVYSADTIRNSKLEVVLNPYNFAPFGGFAKAAGSTPNSSDTKIIYTVRHGNTPHNEDARVFGRPVAWRYLAMLQKNFDPAITPTGVGNARGAADMLVDMMVAEGAPRPVTIYSSPLRRCVETAMQM
ncbi:hypothetical protein diail_3953 [Diaporthe ilicicola]|nr:hypothetical protein diail_3953 [Diaporthe ilicicola]